MEIVTKHKKQTKPNPLFEKHLLTQKICFQKNIPKEIAHHITLYQIAVQNIDILSKLSKNPLGLKGWGRCYSFHILSSKKEYKTFLKLPREVREHIARPTNNIIGIIQHPKWYAYYSNYMGTVIKLKWILPENEKKKYLPKILLRQDGWCYCA